MVSAIQLFAVRIKKPESYNRWSALPYHHLYSCEEVAYFLRIPFPPLLYGDNFSL